MPTTPPKKTDPRLALVALVVIVIVAVGAIAHAVSGWRTRAAAKKLKNPVPATADALAAGAHAYKDHCQRCHGEKGDGKGEKAAELSVAPGDFTDVEKMHEQTDGELYWEITKGRHPMPAFEDKLTDEQRWQLVDFIRTFAARAPSDAAPRP